MVTIIRGGVATPVWHCVTIKANVDWMKRVRVRGVVIGSRMLFSESPSKIPTWLFRHELEHVYQQIREGTFRFYLKYFWYSLRYGYKDNPFEVEARERQHDPLTTNEEQLLWKLRGVSHVSRVA